MCKIVVKKEGGKAWPVSLGVVEDVTDFGLCYRRGVDSQRFWIRSGSLLRTMSRMFPLT